MTFGGHYHQIENNIFTIYQEEGVRGIKKQLGDINHILRADYSFPICYPDIAILNLAFIKRLRANLFFDYGYRNTNHQDKTVSSFGIELMLDSGIFNFGSIANLPIGVRFSYLNGVNYTTNIQFVVNSVSF
jgi:hypothetical protein